MNEKEKDKVIKDAQYRKGLSIAFFNATNSAIALVASLPINDPNRSSENNTLVTIARLRDWFLEEHKNYYATVISNVGVNYDIQKTIEKLEATKDIEELHEVWLSISEDERRDKTISALKNKLKKQYETIQ